MEQRNLLLAIVLSVGILIGFQFLIEHFHLTKPAAPPTPATGTVAPAPDGATSTPGVAGPQAVPGAPAAPAVLTREAAVAEQQRVRINTPRLHGSIALRGGRIDDLTLATYHETTDPTSPEVVLLEPTGTGHAYFAEFGWVGGDVRDQRARRRDAVDRLGRSADPDLAGHIDLGQRPGARLYAHDLGRQELHVHGARRGAEHDRRRRRRCRPTA